MHRAPRTSIVTPFFNTAAYLEQCIESVLAQSDGDFEYLLVNNCSTDGSRDIAARYASLDSRIRLIDNTAFVGQVENYNGAIAQVAPDSSYVKVVQADDFLMKDCIARMVDIAERHSSVGLVSSYFLRGSRLQGEGIPYGQESISGLQACRLLMSGVYPLASPTTTLYRAGIVRERRPFYALGRLHEDTEAHVEILLNHDLGFAHQVLSYLRVHEGSIMAEAGRFSPVELDHLILLVRYGEKVLTAEEYKRRLEYEWRAYRGILARAVLHGRGREFWDYHRRGLRSIQRELSHQSLALPVAKQLARWLLEPLELPTRMRERKLLRGR